MSPAVDERDRIRAAMDRILAGTLERTAWIAAQGPGITPGGPVLPLHHTDVAAHVYAAL